MRRRLSVGSSGPRATLKEPDKAGPCDGSMIRCLAGSLPRTNSWSLLVVALAKSVAAAE